MIYGTRSKDSLGSIQLALVRGICGDPPDDPKHPGKEEVPQPQDPKPDSPVIESPQKDPPDEYVPPGAPTRNVPGEEEKEATSESTSSFH